MKRYIRSDLYINDEGRVKIEPYEDSHNGIKTERLFRNQPLLKCEDKLLGGHKVYSVFGFNTSDHVDILKEVKHKNVAEDEYDYWLDVVGSYIRSKVFGIEGEPDVVLVPQSSSDLALELTRNICRKRGIDYIPNAFVKNPVDEIKIVVPDGIEVSDDTLDKLENLLDKIKANGKFEAKNVPKRFLKFFRNIYEGDEFFIDDIEGRNVMIVDDSMTSKSTMMNLFDVCDNLYGASHSFGVTLFKKTGSR